MSAALASPAIVTHPLGMKNFRTVIRRAYAMFAPPPDITVSEWARRNRVLPKGTTSRPGPFRPEKFQVEMMDVFVDPNVHHIVIQKSTQIGYNDAVVNNVIGYVIDVDPKPIMLVEPTIDNAKDYGKKRIAPMIANCPPLREKVREATSRRAGNTLTLKEYPGGFLKLTGANAGSGLRSDPVPIVIFDEVDGYPEDVDGEGDPIEIGTRRTDQFPDYKIVKGSTPARPKEISRIVKAYERSDQREFHVPCPFCGFAQPLVWRDPVSKDYRLVYEVAENGVVVRSSVAYLCAKCRGRITERYKQQMLDAGSWIPRFPGRDVVGFYINALYSPWRENWHELAQEWSEANRERSPEKLKAFINLRLGEPWEEDGDALEAHSLRARCEKYPEDADVPNGVGLLTASVDVQSSGRLECAVKGWGAKEESWLITYQQFFGDPGREEVWNELDEFLGTKFRHASGREIAISATFIDSGGHNTDDVYKFVKARQSRRIFACRGASESGKEILSKYSLNNRLKVKLFTIGTDTAKDRIFARMKIPAPAPGFMHLPDWIDDEYLEQLTSEKAVRRYKKGRGAVREYIKTRERNEALDLEVYALAALYSLGNAKLRSLEQLATEFSTPIERETPATPATPATSTTWGNHGGFINSWRP